MFGNTAANHEENFVNKNFYGSFMQPGDRKDPIFSIPVTVVEIKARYNIHFRR